MVKEDQQMVRGNSSQVNSGQVNSGENLVNRELWKAKD